MNKKSLLLVPIALLVLALGLAACGGGDDDDDTTAGAPAGAPAERGADAERDADGADGQGSGGNQGSGSAGGGGVGKGGSGANRAPASLEVDVDSIPNAIVTETGAVQTLEADPADHEIAQKNMYGSIREFGTEVSGEEATNITFALVQFLTAKEQGDWPTACARLYSVLRESFEEQAKDGSCPQLFGALMSRSAKSNRAEQARIDVSSIRRGEGNRAFVIYKTPKTLSADMPMYVEDGVWKVGAIEAYALTPEQVG